MEWTHWHHERSNNRSVVILVSSNAPAWFNAVEAKRKLTSLVSAFAIFPTSVASPAFLQPTKPRSVKFVNCDIVSIEDG
jgi:hypothetical protein